ncbi:glycosyltransferase family 4 protein [Arenibaculum sp.]|jgi:glycosyltransferase involved in cell wall biosynthesis|uniref:glycosyltransferase family 4 protein n=1 Tax=Arenibaculum sp. TaxID=2865862 RepID=UPI002E14CD3E|nr:glycosyltransferase family 4 protein [Arenibaculum sp.]
MTTDTIGGVWDYSLELAAGLAEHGISVDLAALGAAPQPARLRPIPGLRLYHLDCRLEWMRDSEEDVARSGDWLLALERRTRPDIVHVNGFAHAALPFPAPVLAVVHSCVLSWWRHVHGADAPAEWNGYAGRVRAGLAAARLVTAPTRAMLEEARALYGPLPHARVLHNGRDPRRYPPGRKEPLVLGAGRLWDDAKNVAALAAAAKHLEWPVVLAGAADHPEGGSIPLDGVRCLGALPSAELARWFARAAVFAMPARYEPFGLSVLEAAMAGCALVLGDIGSLRELWDEAALFVPPDDVEALASAIRRLAADDALRDRMSDAARTRARRYTADRMTEGYVSAYSDILVEPAAGFPFAGRGAATAAPAILPSPAER